MSKQTFLSQLKLVYNTRRFPWKKHALVGWDLTGNEYWDSPNPLGGRDKRWVKMIDNREGDLTVFSQNKLAVQWQAWLRHTRYEPPSLQELLVDEKRKAIVQDRARVLDEQWEQRKLELAAQKEKDEMETLRLLQEAEQKKTTEPSGHGDDFAPGEWMPSSSKRGTS